MVRNSRNVDTGLLLGQVEVDGQAFDLIVCDGLIEHDDELYESAFNIETKLIMVYRWAEDGLGCISEAIEEARNAIQQQEAGRDAESVEPYRMRIMQMDSQGRRCCVRTTAGGEG